MDGILIILVFLIILTILIWVYIKWLYSYWSRKKIPYLPGRFPFGTSTDNMWTFFRSAYLSMKQHRYFGIYLFTEPALLINDPELIRRVLITDFESFNDRGVYSNPENDPFSLHLVSAKGPVWKKLRLKLTPTFTSGKLKAMVDVMVVCGQNLCADLDLHIKNAEPIDMSILFENYGMNVIGACAFGMDMTQFTDTNSAFKYYARKGFQEEIWHMLLTMMCPNLAKFLRIRVFDQETTDFFTNLIEKTIEERRKSGVERPDFLQLMLRQLDENVDEPNRLSKQEVLNQCLLFLGAGLETTTSLLGLIMYKLSKYPEVQEKLRKEILDVLSQNKGQITYDILKQMTYLGQVINEVLRLLPPAPIHARVCTQDYKIPDSDFIIEKGTKIFIPIAGIHCDDQYFAEPDQFKPERFADDLKHKLFIPFGDGPRICIGMRLALVEIKVCLAELLSQFQFELNEKMQKPLEFRTDKKTLTIKGGVWLNVSKI